MISVCALLQLLQQDLQWRSSRERHQQALTHSLRSRSASARWRRHRLRKWLSLVGLISPQPLDTAVSFCVAIISLPLKYASWCRIIL
jgi:hypothetical protein